MANIPDMKATNIACQSLSNDVSNLLRAVSGKPPPTSEESKTWAFAGHQGRTVLVDRRPPAKPNTDNKRYTASSWKIGARATEVHPVTGQHTYDTGNLYRTVHWQHEGFGLNGRFTDNIQRAGLWRNDGLNVSSNKSKVLGDPTGWGSTKDAITHQ